jgi:hypothetical protein
MNCNYYVKLKRVDLEGLMEKRFKSGENIEIRIELRYMGVDYPVHIGKCSFGWKFLFRLHPFYSDYKTLKKWIKDKVIIDEYGRIKTYRNFVKMIKYKQQYKHHFGTRGYRDIKGYDFLDIGFI